MWSNYFTIQQHPHWGATLAPPKDELEHFYANSDCCSLLESVRLIKVTGVDAAKFLQGQTTCDFNSVLEGQPKLGAHCNVKGRIQAAFLTFHQHDAFYLMLPADLATDTLATLQKFALFSQVSLALSDDYLICAFNGQTIASSLNKLGHQTHEHLNTVSVDWGLFASIPYIGTLGFVLPAKLAEFEQQIKQSNLKLCGESYWQRTLIQQGIALPTQIMSEQWLPQELNYDLIAGVSFNKGCYKGQEIIARIHYRGQTKVRTYPLRIQFTDVDIQLQSTQTWVAHKLLATKPIGTVIQTAAAGDNAIFALATLKIDCAEAENLTLDTSDPHQIKLLPASYAIPKGDSS